MNYKKTSSSLASKASKALSDRRASSIQKALAGSVLSQRNARNQTGSNMEATASRVLQSTKYSQQTKSFAASILSQSNKSR